MKKCCINGNYIVFCVVILASFTIILYNAVIMLQNLLQFKLVVLNVYELCAVILWVY